MTRNGWQLARARAASGHAEAQRVDNCKVPLDLRGPKPRPAECDDGASTRSNKSPWNASASTWLKWTKHDHTIVPRDIVGLIVR